MSADFSFPIRDRCPKRTPMRLTPGERQQMEDEGRRSRALMVSLYAARVEAIERRVGRGRSFDLFATRAKVTIFTTAKS